MPETLYDLKAGDEVVIVHYGPGSNDHSLVQICRATPTQFITETQQGHTQHWRKKDGQLVGRSNSHYFWREVVLASPEMREKVAKERAIDSIESFAAGLQQRIEHLRQYPLCRVLAILDRCNQITAIRQKVEGDAN